MIQLATCKDGRTLSYDATLYEFRIDRDVVSYQSVLFLDNHAKLTWRANEQRDWFRKINPVDLDRCNRRALNRHGNGYGSMTAEEQVQADAKRNDSILAGKIVDADPALVRAVADALEAEGLVGRGAGIAPQAVIGMPQGMEALSQLQKQEGRKMTLMEHYLMRQILKNDDKEKAKREQLAAQIEQKAEREAAKAERRLATKAKIHDAQKRAIAQDAREAKAIKHYSDEALQATMGYQATVGDSSDMTVDRAIAMAEAGSAARFGQMPGVDDNEQILYDAQGRPVRVSMGGQVQAAPAIEYTDSYGRPIRPEADAMRPSMSQVAYVPSEEERALVAMREKNLAHQSMYTQTSTDVPGMEALGGGRGRGRRNEGASINGHEVNADGTIKDTKFKKFMGGLGEFNKAMSPLLGGGGMGGPGGGMGGSGGGGGMGGPGGGMGGGR